MAATTGNAADPPEPAMAYAVQGSAKPPARDKLERDLVGQIQLKMAMSRKGNGK